MSQITAKVHPLTSRFHSSSRQNACITYHVYARRLWNCCHKPPPPLSMALQPLVGQDHLTAEASLSHSHTLHSIGLLWTSDQPDAETSTWHHTKLMRDRHPCRGGIRTRNPSMQAAADHRAATGIGMKLLLGFGKFNYVVFPHYIFYQT